MIQAIQVLRFHLLELEKVNMIFVTYSLKKYITFNYSAAYLKSRIN